DLGDDENHAEDKPMPVLKVHECAPDGDSYPPDRMLAGSSSQIQRHIFRTPRLAASHGPGSRKGSAAY
ncbi:MAG: hypothetical protein Q8R89_08910, partial [Desulfomicrobium sp.]|nr:hypothetical protein [Desulfomicrobium sp.]